MKNEQDESNAGECQRADKGDDAIVDGAAQEKHQLEMAKSQSVKGLRAMLQNRNFDHENALLWF